VRSTSSSLLSPEPLPLPSTEDSSELIVTLASGPIERVIASLLPLNSSFSPWA
jgi:hypothetical protein